MSKRTTISDVLEAVHALASHMDGRMDQFEKRMDILCIKMEEKVDREEFYQKMGEMKSEITTQIDQFITLHQKVDLETVALRSRCERIETRLAKHGIN